MSQLIVLETRRSKGFHKADLTKFSKEDIKKALEYYNSSSFVAVRNYRAKADDKEVIEIKFHRMSAKGQVKYSLKTVLTKEELKELGFVESPKKNLHKTQSGCTIDTAFDVEVKGYERKRDLLKYNSLKNLIIIKSNEISKIKNNIYNIFAEMV